MIRHIIKFFPIALLGLVALAVIAAVILLGEVNSEANKRAIAAAVEEKTGYRLNFGGDIRLKFFPAVALSLSDVRLQNPLHPQELVSLATVDLKIALLPLFSRRLNVHQVRAENVHLNYFADAEGRSIWAIGQNAQAAVPNPAASGSGGEGLMDRMAITLESLNVLNASVDIQLASTGSRFRLARLNIESSNINLAGGSFRFGLDFDYANNGLSDPVPVRMQGRVAADLENGRLGISEFRASVTPLMLSGDLAISDLDGAPTYSGQLAADSFDVVSLLESLGVLAVRNPVPAELGLAEERQVAFDLQFSGDAEQAELGFQARRHNSTDMEATATLRLATELLPLAVSYSLSAEEIDLSPLLPQKRTTRVTDASGERLQPSPVAEPVERHRSGFRLPVELLNSMTVLGSMAIGSVRMHDWMLTDVELLTHLEDGVMDIEVLPLDAFDGSLHGNLRLNARDTTPALEVSANSTDLNLSLLTPVVSRLRAVGGFLRSESSYTASGITASELMRSLTGTTAFEVTESSIDIGMIKQVFTAIAALGPGGETIQQWPDVIRFNEVVGNHLLLGGPDQNQELELRMDNFAVSGTGGIDPDAGSLGFDLLFSVLGASYPQTIPINPLYHDVPWPVQCSAAFSDEINRSCRPDFSEVRQIFTRLGSNAVRNRLDEAVIDRLPEELEEAARSLLRNPLNRLQ